MKNTFSQPWFISLCGIASCTMGKGAMDIKAESPQKPNVIVILADDIGYGDLSAYGATRVSTPNVERLANNGIRFTNAHAVASTSTPSRYSMLTGHYAFRRNDTGIAQGDAYTIIKPEQGTVAKMMQGAGYVTAAVGKWHLGIGDKNGQNWNGYLTPGPKELGFDYSYIMAATGDRVPCVFIENQRVANYDPGHPIAVSYNTPFPGEPLGKDHPEMLTVMKPSNGHDQAIVNGISRIGYMKGGGKALWWDENIADTITSKAVSFIEANKDKPFFLYFATNDIHVPRVPHPRFSNATEMGARGNAIAEFDWSVGEIINVLERNGLLENTILIVTSDNGPVLDDGYIDGAVELAGSHKPAGILSGGKYSNNEGGTRIPFIVHWPAEVSPKVSDALVSQIDLYASLAALTGESLSKDDAPDSFDQMETWLGKNDTGRPYFVGQPGLVIVKDGWKYIQASGALYDLTSDIGEKTNKGSQYPEVRTELSALLSKVVSGTRTREEITGTKLTIISATAKGSDGLTAEQSSEYSIRLTFDGNYDNEYSSQWQGLTKMPVTLEYFLDAGSDKLDKMVYYPKGPANSNVNGTFRTFTVYVKTATSDYEKTGDYVINITNKDDISQIKAPQIFEFEKSYKNPVSVKIVVNSTYHVNANNTPQLVSCGEMEFYKNTGGSSINKQATDNPIKLYHLNGYIKVVGSSEPIEAFSSTGSPVNVSEKLQEGVYIVKVGDYIGKVIIK